LSIYGVLFFLLLFYFNEIPKEYKLYYQGIYTYVEYLAFASILWYNINSKSLRRLIVICSIFFLIFQLLYVPTQSLKKLDSIPIGIETILIFIYVAFFLFENFQRTTNSNIYNHYCFWICIGILIYLGGSFFFYILINNLSEEQIAAFGTMTYVADIIKNLLFGIALFIYARKSNERFQKKSNTIPFLDMI